MKHLPIAQGFQTQTDGIIAPMNQIIETYSLEQLADVVKELGLPKFRTQQITAWLYANYAGSYDDMSDLSKQLRATLAEEYPLSRPRIVDQQISSDQTRKLVLELHDGVLVETVGIPTEDDRLTVCCSSQSGCAMNCAFCATGKSGFRRNLLPGEIAEQILIVSNQFEKRVSNVVVMGQGEPFANYDNTVSALHIINHPKLIGVGARRITVSTCGVIPGIKRFAQEPEQFTLAISLHSAVQETRNYLMPGVSNYSLVNLRKAVQEYLEKTDRRVTFEYALMRGVNDSNRELNALIEFCSGLLCHVNLIPLNEIPNSPFHPVSHRCMQNWCDRLDSAGINATIRHSRGSDIAGACGQLANSYRSGL